jgi:hypothetical protein
MATCTQTVEQRSRSAQAQAFQGVGGHQPLLSKRDLASWLGLSLRSLEMMRSSGRLPAPDVVFGRLPRWRVETIKAWLDAGGTK